MTPHFTLLLSFICAATIGNLYLGQPLLAELATYFEATPDSVAVVATLAQIGYGLGVLLIVPLGDLLERKSLILKLLACVFFALIFAATAQHLTVLSLASLLIGFTTVVPQVIIPYAASLALPQERGKLIGTVQSGLLIGILLARTVSGTIASAFDWRASYEFAAILTVGMAGFVYWRFPKQEGGAKRSYRSVLFSMITLFKGSAILRKVSFMSMLNFAAFSLFWTTLAFLLKSSFNYGPGVVGLFGVIGVAGALVAGFAGKLSDLKGPRYTQLLSGLVTLLSFMIYVFAEHSIVLLVIGVIIMDAGVQAAHISFQAEALSIVPEARSRLNGIYMFIRFLGGAAGSLVGASCWHYFGWTGVALMGCGLSLMSLVPVLIPQDRRED